MARIWKQHLVYTEYAFVTSAGFNIAWEVDIIKENQLSTTEKWTFHIQDIQTNKMNHGKLSLANTVPNLKLQSNIVVRMKNFEEANLFPRTLICRWSLEKEKITNKERKTSSISTKTKKMSVLWLQNQMKNLKKKRLQRRKVFM